MNRYEDHPSFGAKGDLLPQIKRVAAVHDISCLGRCALTVIIPVLSAMGIQAVPLPTALLSTHTGGFQNMFFEDLTPHMSRITDHWRSMGTDFDAIYSGFLGSSEQIETLLSFLRDFSRKNDGSKTFIAIDPVMGDDGELYSTYDSALAEGMKRLCYGADVITPNLTEACILTGEKYPSERLSPDEARALGELLIKKLEADFGSKRTVLTGIEAFADNYSRVLSLGSELGNGEVFYCSVPKRDRSYPGTGDVFASVLLGDLLLGRDFKESLTFASEFVCRVIAFSEGFATPIRDGLVIEPCLSALTENNNRS